MPCRVLARALELGIHDKRKTEGENKFNREIDLLVVRNNPLFSLGIFNHKHLMSTTQGFILRVPVAIIKLPDASVHNSSLML